MRAFVKWGSHLHSAFGVRGSEGKDWSSVRISQVCEGAPFNDMNFCLQSQAVSVYRIVLSV